MCYRGKASVRVCAEHSSSPCDLGHATLFQTRSLTLSRSPLGSISFIHACCFHSWSPGTTDLWPLTYLWWECSCAAHTTLTLCCAVGCKLPYISFPPPHPSPFTTEAPKQRHTAPPRSPLKPPPLTGSRPEWGWWWGQWPLKTSFPGIWPCQPLWNLKVAVGLTDAKFIFKRFLCR